MNEWIECSQLLPETSEGKKCSDDVLLSNGEFVRLGYLNSYNKWIAYLFNDSSGDEEVFPSHWMKLSPPPLKNEQITCSYELKSDVIIVACDGIYEITNFLDIDMGH